MTHSKSSNDETGAHGGDKPWVFFMVDCFFLICEFFILTFQFKHDEAVLPQRLPSGGTRPTQQNEISETLMIHVTHPASGNAAYDIMGSAFDKTTIQSRLADAARLGDTKIIVKVSYDGEVPFEDVMEIFNTCTKVKVNDCGIIPIRAGGVNYGK